MQCYALKVHKFSIGILGSSGYVGRELCSLVAQHPAFELAFASASSRAGSKARISGRDITFIDTDEAPLGDVDLVFSALPHGVSGNWVRRALESVSSASVVANPGCYPTAILIALAPLIKRGLTVPGGTISISAASGVTGAGYTPRPDLLFAEVAEDFRAYALGNVHRHLSEMRAVANAWGGDSDLIFLPHLLPVARGILATITVPMTQRLGNPLAIWEEEYAAEPFIEVASEAPSLRDVVRRNVVRLSATYAADVRQPTLIVIAAVDNLMKGAAGQAVQNANLMLGLNETVGLPG